MRCILCALVVMGLAGCGSEYREHEPVDFVVTETEVRHEHHPAVYQILYRDSRDGLERAVEEEMNKGWVPQGGVSVTRVPMQAGYYQSMTKAGGKDGTS